MLRFTPKKSQLLFKGPDGYGFLYANTHDGSQVNILPPKSDWRGQMVLEEPGDLWKLFGPDKGFSEHVTLLDAVKAANERWHS